jgi:hypothetical protein
LEQELSQEKVKEARRGEGVVVYYIWFMLAELLPNGKPKYLTPKCHLLNWPCNRVNERTLSLLPELDLARFLAKNLKYTRKILQDVLCVVGC